jgi:hypothetical protein
MHVTTLDVEVGNAGRKPDGFVIIAKRTAEVSERESRPTSTRERQRIVRSEADGFIKIGDCLSECARFIASISTISIRDGFAIRAEIRAHDDLGTSPQPDIRPASPAALVNHIRNRQSEGRRYEKKGEWQLAFHQGPPDRPGPLSTTVDVTH